MKNFWIRTLSLALSIVMSVQMLPISAWATGDETVPGETAPGETLPTIWTLPASEDLSNEPEVFTPLAESPAVTEDNLNIYFVDPLTGEETYPGGEYDLSDRASWPRFQAVPCVYYEDGTSIPITTGKTEFFWTYSIGHDEGSGGTPVGMMPGKWAEKVADHQWEYPDDWDNLLLMDATDGWTTNPNVPEPMTLGQLMGIDMPCYPSRYRMQLFMRHTTDSGEKIMMPWPALYMDVGIMNSKGIDGYLIPTEYPDAVGAKPLDWGLGGGGVPMSLRTDAASDGDIRDDVIIGGDVVINPDGSGSGGYPVVHADIHEWDTPVVYLPYAMTEQDGLIAPGAYCDAWGLDNGNCGCYSYLWVVPADGGDTLDMATATPRDFVPVGTDPTAWQRMCDAYAAEEPEAWAAGDYTGLYNSEELRWEWYSRLPVYSEDNISGADYEHSYDIADYKERVFACVVRWEHWHSIYDEEGYYQGDESYICFGYGDPVKVIPSDGPYISEEPEDPENPEEPEDTEDTRHKAPSPLPESYIRGLEWFDDIPLYCDASYRGKELTYQWFRSLTPAYNGTPLDDDYAQEAEYFADFPEADELDLTYYYYCEYTFTDIKGVTQTHRTTICALRRAPCSMLEVKVAPGAFYLKPDPTNTNYYSPEYIRYSNNFLPLSDPDDYTLPYAYQVYGGESVLSAWIETESLYSSYGFRSSDYITWQWYRSETEDWTKGEKVGAEGKAEGLTEISLWKPLVSGTQSLINYNAFNKHANIHVNCPTDTLEPFYMTVVITNHYTNIEGEHVTSTSTARCKVFTVEKNEDLYSVDSNGMLDGYNGHESVWNIPAEIDGVKVTTIGEMAEPVKPPADSDVRHYSGPTKIVIPEGVTEILDDAFYRLYSLEAVELPNTLKRIGKYSFGGTGAIENLILPASVEEVAVCAFAGSLIRSFEFHKDVWPVIGKSAFSQSGLRHVVFPANATGKLAGNTFYNSQSLAAVVNWTNIQELDRDSDFKFTPAYEYMVEGSGGDSDGNFVYLPDEKGTGWIVVQCIMEDPTNVVIPAYFKGKPVTTVGRGKGLGAVAAGAAVQLVEDVLKVRHVVLPETVHTINERAFDGCENLETVTFHSNIKLVKSEAFQNCYRLKSTVTLATGARIETEAFNHCRSITRLDAPGAYIETYAFAYCFSLEHVTAYIPWLPEYNSDTAYSYRKGYSYWPFPYTKTYTDAREAIRIYYDPEGEPERSKNRGRRYGNVYYDVNESDPTKGEIQFYMGHDEYDIYIPGKVPAVDGDYEVTLVEVDSNVFDYMTSEYHDVEFGEGISIFHSAFSTGWKTTRMRHVKLPQSAADLGTFFQSEIDNKGLLESINIPAGVIELKENAFQGNTKLHTVIFEEGSKLVNIGNSAFRNCASLKNLDFTKLTQLVSIGRSAFSGHDLREIDLRKCTKLKLIDGYAFADSYNLRSIFLPDSLETIGIYAFEDAACHFDSSPKYLEVVDTLYPLEELVLPKNLKKIGKGAFRGQFMDNTANDPFVLDLPDSVEWIGSGAFGGYDTNVQVDMELWSNIVLKDGRLPENLKIFGNYTNDLHKDDSVVMSLGGPFSKSTIDTLIFPAGMEILGQYACYDMPKLHTVIFEAKMQWVPVEDAETDNNRPAANTGENLAPDGAVETFPVDPESTLPVNPDPTEPEPTRPTEPNDPDYPQGEYVLTSSLKYLYPNSLSSYDYYGYVPITNIQGFENLRMLEYMEDVFSETVSHWEFSGDSYTVPGTMKYLGQFALTDYGFSPFRNIILSEGIDEIADYAVSKRADQVGDYITALETFPRGTKLAEEWLDSQDFNTDKLTTLRCYTGSSYHIWADEQNYPYELLDPDARVVFVDLTLDGTAVPRTQEWIDTCQWVDSKGNVVSNEYVLRNAVEGETYTCTVTLTQDKLMEYALPYSSATVKLEAGSRYAYGELPLSPRTSVTIQGVLPQHGAYRFDARVVQSNYPYAVIAYVYPDFDTGEFTVEIPRVDCKLVLTADEETAYVKTEYLNFAWMGTMSGNIQKVGSLPMDIGPMYAIPISNSVSLRSCGALKLTDEKGNVYPVHLVERIVKGEKMDCLYILNALHDGVTIGDKLTLSSHVSDAVKEAVIPYTFTVPQFNIDFYIEPEVTVPGRVVNQAGGCVYLYDHNGKYMDRLSYSTRFRNLEPGDYTAIQIDNQMFQGLSLKEFLALDLPEALYRRTDFTIHEQFGQEVVIDQPCPKFDYNVLYGVSVTANESMADADGIVPITIQLNFSNAVPEGPVKFTIQCNGIATPFVAVGGQLVIPDQPGTVTDVKNTGGYGFSSKLEFTTTARTGVITLYAKSDGSILRLTMEQNNVRNSMGTVRLPQKGFDLNAPPAVTHEANGNLTLFAQGSISGYKAAVLVNGVEQGRYSLKPTGTGSNILPYTLKTYADGSSLHVLQVAVYDKNGVAEWVSQEYTVTHTNTPIPEPLLLDIRITNLNATDKNGNYSNVDGVNTVEHASLNYITGEYKPMKFVVPFWYYNKDGTMQKEITFDYALTMSNPELVEDQQMILKVFFNSGHPYTRQVTLRYNKMTGTFDGTLHIPGNTLSMNDMPYGVTLVYSNVDQVTEAASSQFLMDRAQEKYAAQVNLENVEPEKLEIINIDRLHLWLDEKGISEYQRDKALEVAVLHNEMVTLVTGLDQNMKDMVDGAYGMGSGKDKLLLMQQYLQQSGVSANLMNLDAPTTPQELLEMGYKEFRMDGVTVYVAQAEGSSRMVWLDPDTPANSRMLICSNLRFFAKSSDSGNNDLAAISRQIIGITNTLLGTLDLTISTAVETMTALCEKLAKQKALVDSLNSSTMTALDEWLSSEDDLEAESLKNKFAKYQKDFQDAIAELESLKAQVKVAKADVAAGNFQALTSEIGFMKSVGAKLTAKLGSLAKVVPAIGTVVGIILNVYDLVTLGLSVVEYSTYLDARWNEYDQYNEMVNTPPSGTCVNEENMSKCSKAIANYRDAIQAMQTAAYVYFSGKLALLVVDIGATIATIAVGVGNIAGAAIGLGSALLGVGADALFNSQWNNLKSELSGAVRALGYSCTGLWENCEEEEPTDPGDPGDDEPEDEEPTDPDDPGDEEPEDDTPPKLKADPSGYVYEAVASNRIEGATAQIFWKDKNGNEVFWDEAPDYDEVNPQTTDRFGQYGWMTPPGDWLVKITKDGYLPADSALDPAAVNGWLPVPPPQLDVNIGLVSTAAPKVVYSGAASDRVQLVFSQYMDIAQLTADPGLITVTQDGQVKEVSFSFADREESPTKAGVFYGRILNITCADGFSSGDIQVTVSKDLRNYADTAMGEVFSKSMKVTAIPGAISHSYPNRMVVNVGDTVVISAQLTDTLGKPMAGVSVDLRALYGDILRLEGETTAVSNANGIITFRAVALRSGSDFMNFSTVNGVETTMEIYVNPFGSEKPAKPTANLSDYAVVTVGTQLILSTTEPNATIYYTTNNTCPCTDSPERKVYTGPVELTESGFYRIAVYTEAGGYSERLNLHITVTEAAGKEQVTVAQETQSYVYDGEAKIFAVTGTALTGFQVSYRLNGMTVEQPIHAGSYDVLIERAEDAQYAPFYLLISGGLVIEKAPGTLETDTSLRSALCGEKLEPRAAVAHGQLRYSGSDPTVASVDPVTGVITAITSGQILITVTAVGNEDIQEASASYFLSVTHDLYPDWTWGSGKHYHECVCGAVVDEAACSGGQATCQEKAVCAVCGNCYGPEPAGHSWGQWVETVKPDATRDGVNTRVCTACGETETEVVDNNIFSDVKKDRFESAILWAYYGGITTGTGDGTTFSPENACTRKQIVTFLWRAAGEPEPKSMVNPFKDVKQDRFEKAILWAYYEGITAGTGDGSTFSPENTCTRKQIVTFLWRYNGQPAPKSMENKFVDVKNDRFTAAILWAAEQGITTGTGDGTTFSPEDPCTRKQIVTFLYRNLSKQS